MIFEVYINEALKDVRVIPAGARATLEGYEPLAPVIHDADGDELGPALNHVLWHHVRDVLYANGHQNPALYTISMNQDGTPIQPLVPGPMEIIVKEPGGFNDFTHTFDLASPDVIFALAAKVVSGSPIITITHGGEIIPVVNIIVTAETMLVQAVGHGLSMERADLKISIEGGSVGGGFLRINELKNVRDPKTENPVYYYGANPNEQVRITEGHGGRLKYIQGTHGRATYSDGLGLVTNNPGNTRMFTGRIVDAEYPVEWEQDWNDPRWRFNSTWELTEEGYMRQNRPGGSAYFGSRFEVGEFDNGVCIIDVVIPENGAIKFGSRSGDYLPGETVYGPFEGQLELLAYMNNCVDLIVYMLGVATIKSVKFGKNAKPFSFSYGDGGQLAEGPNSNYFYLSRNSTDPIAGLLVEVLGENFEEV